MTKRQIDQLSLRISLAGAVIGLVGMTVTIIKHNPAAAGAWVAAVMWAASSALAMQRILWMDEERNR